MNPLKATLNKPTYAWLVNAKYILLLAVLALSACASHQVKTTAYVQLEQETSEIPEAQLLDVGVVLLEPNLEQLDEDEDALVFAEVRKAESHFMALHLSNAIQASSAWGAVRVIPNNESMIDVVLEGKILHSEGETLELEISVSDIKGHHWYTKEYQAVASRYAYTRETSREADPFQTIYNQIANDLLNFRRQFSGPQLAQLRTIGELRFAQNFSPESFSGFLQQDKKGIYQISRLPADADPMLSRVRSIRDRDHLFVDTLQDYYGAFVDEIDGPYKDWRKQTYREVIALRNIKRQSRNETIAGIVAVLGGIAAQTSGNRATRASGAVAMGAGGYLLKEGFGKRAEAKLQEETLRELGDSLEASIAPQVIELEDRTVTLSGTVEQQYQQWRKILRELYQVEVGQVEVGNGAN